MPTVWSGDSSASAQSSRGSGPRHAPTPSPSSSSPRPRGPECGRCCPPSGRWRTRCIRRASWWQARLRVSRGAARPLGLGRRRRRARDVHLLVEANIPAAPLWLNEGLAEFFAAGRFDQSPAVFGLPHAGHLLVLRTQPWLLSRRCCRRRAARSASAIGDLGGLLCSGVGTGPLPETRRRRPACRHADSVSAQLARGARRRRGRGIRRSASLERRLRDYVNGERFFDARLPVPVAAEGDPVERAPAWDAVLLLGDFLTHVARHGEAARLLAHAAAMAPASAAVCERQALLAFQRQDLPRSRTRGPRGRAGRVPSPRPLSPGRHAACCRHHPQRCQHPRGRAVAPARDCRLADTGACLHDAGRTAGSTRRRQPRGAGPHPARDCP